MSSYIYTSDIPFNLKDCKNRQEPYKVLMTTPTFLKSSM